MIARWQVRSEEEKEEKMEEMVAQEGGGSRKGREGKCATASCYCLCGSDTQAVVEAGAGRRKGVFAIARECREWVGETGVDKDGP